MELSTCQNLLLSQVATDQTDADKSVSCLSSCSGFTAQPLAGVLTCPVAMHTLFAQVLLSLGCLVALIVKLPPPVATTLVV